MTTPYHARQATPDDLYAGYVPFLSWWLVYDPTGSNDGGLHVFPSQAMAEAFIEEAE